MENKPSYVLAHAVEMAEEYEMQMYICGSINEEADQVISSIIHLSKQNIPSFCRSSTKGNLEDDPYLRKYSGDFSLADQLPIFPSDTNFVIGTTDADMYQLSRFEGVKISNDVVCKYLSSETPKSVNHLPSETIPALS